MEKAVISNWSSEVSNDGRRKVLEAKTKKASEKKEQRREFFR
jgi:hypothetical protein